MCDRCVVSGAPSEIEGKMGIRVLSKGNLRTKPKFWDNWGLGQILEQGTLENSFFLFSGTGHSK